MVRLILLALCCVVLALGTACSDDGQDNTNVPVDQADADGQADADQPDGGEPDVDDMDEPDAAPPEDVEEDTQEPQDTTEDEDPDPPEDVMEDDAMVDAGDGEMDAEPDAPEDIMEGDIMEPGVPLEGFGALSGQCGVLDTAQLTGTEPLVFVNAIDFGEDPFDEGQDDDFLTEGGLEVLTDDNAGGNSKLSEVFAFEVLGRCELATLLKTENEIAYNDPMGKITDLLVEIDGLKIGVSVTRAVGFPREDPYTVEQAAGLLERKLIGVIDSSANVAPEDAWSKQILSIIAYEDRHAQAMQDAFAMMPPEVSADTILLITVSNGDDGFLY